MALIHLVRHGQASFGSANYDQLSDLGMRQCYLLGQWMHQTQQPVERIILGGMHRHRQSAQAFVEGFGSPDYLNANHWELDANLNEFDHEQVLKVSRPDLAAPGKLMEFLATQARPRAVFEQMFAEAFARWMSGAHDADYAESWASFKHRIGNAISLFQSPEFHSEPRKNTIVFTSAGPITVLCQQIMAVPDSHIMGLLSVMLNSSVSKLIHTDGDLRVAAINAVPHLEIKADKSLISYR
ncbi:histidine phosphatase family protein [Sapientia aquatica]|uniref:Histidine phosphatase family protein n=1 Tax=Sapientia aquatica TaxID=1549640 RepID=A0A4R5W3A5_9BURK|nr:histidine phosphatase family protein [Sapientia aquatica]TDK67203.1 histidine phosphatase family protein [Sapientia aquatica]